MYLLRRNYRWISSSHLLTLFGMTLEVMIKYGGDTFISFKILKEQIIAKKQTVPHRKALILSFLELEGWHCHWVDFTKARGPFGPLGFKILPLLGHLQNLLLHSGRSYYIDLLLIKMAVLAMFQENWSQFKVPSANWQQFP